MVSKGEIGEDGRRRIKTPSVASGLRELLEVVDVDGRERVRDEGDLSHGVEQVREAAPVWAVPTLNTLCVVMCEGKKSRQSGSGASHGGVGPDRVWRLVLDVAARQGRALGQPDRNGRHELKPGHF